MHWNLPALVSALSALLAASSLLEKPSKYQQNLLLQGSACLTSFPCASPPPFLMLLTPALPLPIHATPTDPDTCNS